ncbi:MAG: TonB-dependent receptor plug domain-containing protein, partial [Prevotella sp.]|nr:TonB-dependent receptor plug domain-containing protein [Prevotella sp.]
MKKSLVLFLMAMLVSVTALAQSTIKGKVVDEAGEAIIGASVMIKGSSQGTVTDLDGNFTVQVQPGGVLTISYIGYVTQDVKAANGMKVTLKEDNTTLDDLVVVGYGVQKKSVVTASIAKVSSEDLEGKSRLRADDALKGLAAGVNVTSSSGQPGSKSMIRIRGVGTINNSEPLYIIDGMPTDQDGMEAVNPADIESMEVLKDAASGAIYGARAANGVIL